MESPFAHAAKQKTEGQRLEHVYDVWNESTRLASPAAQIEFRTTLRVICETVPVGASILDLGAGTGRYASALVGHGYHVTAVEPVTKHVEELRSVGTGNPHIQVHHTDALNYLAACDNSSFDAVLCLGPLYHIESDAERLKCVCECARVCADGGTLFFAFVTNDMVVVTQEIKNNPGFLKHGRYDPVSCRIDRFPLVFHNIDDARELLNKAGIKIQREIASDGLSELLRDQINTMDELTYERWYAFHTHCCEKPEFLGATTHLLLVGTA